MRNTEKIREKLCALIKHYGNQRKLAAELSVSQGVISRWTLGKSGIKKTHLAAIDCMFDKIPVRTPPKGKPKFKVGDRVRVVADTALHVSFKGLNPGLLGEVKKMFEGTTPAQVGVDLGFEGTFTHWLGGTLDLPTGLYFYEDELDLVETPKPDDTQLVDVRKLMVEMAIANPSICSLELDGLTIRGIRFKE